MRRLLVMVFVLAACTGGPNSPAASTSNGASPSTSGSAQATPTPTSSASPTPSPTLAGTRQTYKTDAFTVSYTLATGWKVAIKEVNIIELAGPKGSIDIARVDAALDPDDRAGRKTVKIGGSASDFVGWLTAHPYVTTTSPMPATVAGHEGIQLDVELKKSGVPERPYCSGKPCIVVLRVTEKFTPADRLALVQGTGGDRFTVFDIGDLRMVVDVYAARPDAFDAFVTEAQPMIDALEFE